MYAKKSARFAVPVLISALLFSANICAAQEVPQSSPQQQPSRPSGVTVDPSAGPLNPTEPSPGVTPQNENPETPLPNAPQPQAAPSPQPSRPATQSSQSAQEPLGAAAAEQVKTSGGGASRPAGNAIAPAKQHQYRSLLIKLGAVAAAGIAAGAVYGLSHATSSTPPHSATAATK
ncbi:MAG TPA: hypothetical protein VM578_03230 [Candidatus Saccharimonadales bacterium]|nr:hypothetical protein [Candidatus Saccharimonadales bacterium]